MIQLNMDHILIFHKYIEVYQYMYDCKYPLHFICLSLMLPHSYILDLCLQDFIEYNNRSNGYYIYSFKANFKLNYIDYPLTDHIFIQDNYHKPLKYFIERRYTNSVMKYLQIILKLYSTYFWDAL